MANGFLFTIDLVKFSVQSPPSCVHLALKCTQEGGDCTENFTKSVINQEPLKVSF